MTTIPKPSNTMEDWGRWRQERLFQAVMDRNLVDVFPGENTPQRSYLATLMTLYELGFFEYSQPKLVDPKLLKTVEHWWKMDTNEIHQIAEKLGVSLVTKPPRYAIIGRMARLLLRDQQEVDPRQGISPDRPLTNVIEGLPSLRLTQFSNNTGTPTNSTYQPDSPESLSTAASMPRPSVSPSIRETIELGVEALRNTQDLPQFRKQVSQDSVGSEQIFQGQFDQPRSSKPGNEFRGQQTYGLDLGEKLLLGERHKAVTDKGLTTLGVSNLYDRNISDPSTRNISDPSTRHLPRSPQSQAWVTRPQANFGEQLPAVHYPNFESEAQVTMLGRWYSELGLHAAQDTAEDNMDGEGDIL